MRRSKAGKKEGEEETGEEAGGEQGQPRSREGRLAAGWVGWGNVCLKSLEVRSAGLGCKATGCHRSKGLKGSGDRNKPTPVNVPEFTCAQVKLTLALISPGNDGQE